MTKIRKQKQTAKGILMMAREKKMKPKPKLCKSLCQEFSNKIESQC